MSEIPNPDPSPDELAEMAAELEQLLRKIDAEIAVYCDDSSHDGDETPWKIEGFFRIEGRWIGQIAMGLFSPSVKVTGGTKLRGAPDLAGWIDTSKKWHKGLLKAAPGVPPGSSPRYKLKCEQCGVTVPVRYEKLAPILNGLAANGVSAISLSALAAKLRSGDQR